MPNGSVPVAERGFSVLLFGREFDIPRPDSVGGEMAEWPKATVC